MTFYERFERLCLSVGLKPQSREMQAITGVSSPAISNWRNKGALPNADVICRIATHFNVTTDYLLCMDDLGNNKKISTNLEDDFTVLTEQEKLLVKIYREASTEGQFRIICACMQEKNQESGAGNTSENFAII